MYAPGPPARGAVRHAVQPSSWQSSICQEPCLSFKNLPQLETDGSCRLHPSLGQLGVLQHPVSSKLCPPQHFKAGGCLAQSLSEPSCCIGPCMCSLPYAVSQSAHVSIRCAGTRSGQSTQA